jgi:hypothetical protein
MQAMSQDGFSGQSSSQHGIAATAIDLVKAAAGCVVADAKTAKATKNAKKVCPSFFIDKQFARFSAVASRFRVKMLFAAPKSDRQRFPTRWMQHFLALYYEF